MMITQYPNLVLKVRLKKLSKTTATIFDLIKHELINSGENEFFNENKINHNDEFIFMRRIQSYDKKVKEVCAYGLFSNFTFSTPEIDDRFKREFINRFVDRQIKFQVVDVFRSKLLFEMISKQYFIENYYSKIDEFVNQTQTTKRGNKTTAGMRNVFIDQPQNQVNLNLKDDTAEFATNNTIQKEENIQEGNDETKNVNYDVLKDTMFLLDELYKHFDKKLLLQVW